MARRMAGQYGALGKHMEDVPLSVKLNFAPVNSVLRAGPLQFYSMSKGHSYEIVCEISTLNYSLGLN
jgi:hypothetical protein